MEWILVKAFFSLVLVLGAMLALMIVLKKYAFTGKGAKSAVVDVEILGQRLLQPKRSVFVLKVLHKVVVVGLTEQGMQTLTEIQDAGSLAEVEERLDARPPASRWLTWNLQPGSANAPMTFARHLQKCAEGLLRRRPADAGGHPSPDHNGLS
jgi:flagellar biogenesis protein FliO